MSKRWAKGSTPQWRRIRLAVLVRDAYRCRLQIDGVCTVKAVAVHHTQARELVGDDPRYLVAVCQPCNNRVGDPTGHDPEPTPAQWW